MSRTCTERVEPVKSLQEFFRNSVARSMQRQGLQACDVTAHYVVNLLTLFARSEALYDDCESRRWGLKPLALMLADAIDASSARERTHALQRLGDVSLFMSGFFADALADKIVDVDYYISMGEGAYHSLSREIHSTPRGVRTRVRRAVLQVQRFCRRPCRSKVRSTSRPGARRAAALRALATNRQPPCRAPAAQVGHRAERHTRR